MERIILAGDVGGTNTSFALVGKRDGKYRVIEKFLFKTAELPSLGDAVRRVLDRIEKDLGGKRSDICCISAAGPVRDNRCVMTNVPWEISGKDVEGILGVRTRIINDFTAISFGLPLLDPSDPGELTALPFPDGLFPAPSGSVRAVAGAGTGLGVGCLLEAGGTFHAFASEGGHADFAGFDGQSLKFLAWMRDRIGAIPEAELFVSGQGLVNIFTFYRESDPAAGTSTGVLAEIAAAPDPEKPALISAAADHEPVCAGMMLLFVRMYGRFASNMAVTFLPTAGLFLAGGIAAKNEKWFLADGGFMETFSMSYRQVIRDTLRTIPVYIIKDYGISLLGAANAAASLP